LASAMPASTDPAVWKGASGWSASHASGNGRWVVRVRRLWVIGWSVLVLWWNVLVLLGLTGQRAPPGRSVREVRPRGQAVDGA